MKIDTHLHFIPKEYIKLVSKNNLKLQANIKEVDGNMWLTQDQGWSYPISKGFYDINVRLADMDKMKIDMAIVSVSPTLYYYWVEPQLGLEIAQMINNAIYDMVKSHPNKFIGMGTLPMQDIDIAIRELRRCVKYLGFKSIQIGSNVEGIQYDDPKFLSFFKECSELGVVVLMHPYYVLAKDLFRKYYLSNLYGFPLDGAMACTSLIFGGVLDKVPELKIILTHGAGFFPYLFGRLTHGYKVREEPKVNNIKSLNNYLNQLYFDTLVYDEKQLRFLVDFAGADHVLLGTDYAFDMAEVAPVDFVSKSGLTLEQQKLIYGDNISRLLKI